MAKRPAPHRLRTLLVSALALLFLAVTAFLAAPRLGLSGPSVLLVTHEIQTVSVVEEIQSVLSEYQQTNPRVTIEFLPRGSQPGGEDLAILSGFPSSREAWRGTPVAWSGRLWVLAGRSDILESLQGEAAALVRTLQEGSLEPDEWERLLFLIKEARHSPITLGNSHLWPYMLWLQFWTAATHGPSEARELPRVEDFAGSPLESSAEDLRSWRSAGYFHDPVWDLGWAQGLEPLETGEAVFALVSEHQLSALGVGARRTLSFYPFPQGRDHDPWNVGSAHFLAVSNDTRAYDAAHKLLRHLTDPEVTNRLSRATGRPFFSWPARDPTPPLILGSWTTLANTANFRRVSALVLGD